MREFRKTTGRNERPSVWRVGLDPADPETVVICWGLLGGAFQETRDRPGDCGTEGHSDYKTAAEYARFCMEREIRKKKESGYVEWIDDRPAEEVATTVRFDRLLPKNLSFYKPKTEIPDDKLARLASRGRAVWTLKRDGMMHVAVKRSGSWQVYSRRMDLATERFPHIVGALDALNLPDRTILLGEMVLLRKDGTDDFKGTSRICRSDADLARAYQGLGDFPKDAKERAVLGRISYYVFDIAFWDGEDLLRTKPVRDRLALVRHMFRTLEPRLVLNTGLKSNCVRMQAENRLRERLLRKHYIGPVKIFATAAGADLELAKRLGAEGFVVLDAEATYGDKGYSFDGKAQRPSGIYKRKPKFEDEFIIAGTYEGTGRNRGKLGGFYIQQVHPKTGERIDCGKCGGGLTDDQRQLFWQQRNSLLERTVKVEFDSRQEPKDGAYKVRFPVLKGFADKKPEECTCQALADEK